MRVTRPRKKFGFAPTATSEIKGKQSFANITLRHQANGTKTGPPGVQRETVFPAGSVFVARTQARVTGTARGHETTAARTSVDRAAQTDGDPRRGHAEICEPPS